ncbi:hypothetical protein [Cellulomonas endometrii]|uniref:hypothetical protein n=1 Tax=Cellulomonas endometrii TaxID=3036301 RepID=UPI0024AD77DE|nr:hypothetical protein [Cellulomonas endometrii]
MPSPDDLPRSPTGRVPQWVVDEATGAAGVDTVWRPPATPVEGGRAGRRRRRRPRPVLALLVLAAVVLAWWATGGADRLRAVVDTGIGAAPAASVPPPSAELLAIADEAHLSEEGRRLLFAARPAFLDAAAFAGQCEDGHAAVEADGRVGCYRPDGSIVVYAPPDPRLRGFVVETTAHEALHAAWTTLSAREQEELAGLLETAITGVPADDAIHEQITGSVGEHRENRPTELFAYVGTQVWRDGGLGEPLEAVYARFVTDRAALVAVHEAFGASMAQLTAAIDAGYQAVLATETTTAHDRAQYEADARAVASYRQAYEEKVAEVAALPEQQRSGLLLSWTWWDGTDLPMAPAAETLDAAADLLARDDRDLPARLAAVEAAEAANAAERARVDALVADYNALQAQLQP